MGRALLGSFDRAARDVACFCARTCALAARTPDIPTTFDVAWSELADLLRNLFGCEPVTRLADEIEIGLAAREDLECLQPHRVERMGAEPILSVGLLLRDLVSKICTLLAQDSLSVHPVQVHQRTWQLNALFGSCLGPEGYPTCSR